MREDLMPKPSRRAPAANKRTAKPASKQPVIKRVCILTGGGDAPGLNAVLRAFVKTGIGHGLEIYGSEDGFEGLIQPNRLVNLKLASVRGILPRGGSILGCSNRANPFAYPTRDARGKETFIDVSETVIERLREHGIDLLVLVGGDGTMHHAAELEKRGVRVVGVPKTIDNDLAATDYTFGFDTAVSTATWAIDALHSTAESHDRVMLLELMGRYAGWISLSAGIAGGADVVVIPEIPYELERIVAKVHERSAQGASFSLIVVGEGAKPKGGIASTIAKGHKGHLERLGGAAQTLADQLKGKIPHEVRVTVLGHLQRGGSPSAFDRLLGTRFGAEAAWLCKRGEYGKMVALRGQEIVTVPIAETVDRSKLVELDGPLVRTARAVGIELGCSP
jgi:ATP-dependent phosphofructokinase / diphosphate-dependent phosphofructokinase